MVRASWIMRKSDTATTIRTRCQPNHRLPPNSIQFTIQSKPWHRHPQQAPNDKKKKKKKKKDDEKQTAEMKKAPTEPSVENALMSTRALRHLSMEYTSGLQPATGGAEANDGSLDLLYDPQSPTPESPRKPPPSNGARGSTAAGSSTGGESGRAARWSIVIGWLMSKPKSGSAVKRLFAKLDADG